MNITKTIARFASEIAFEDLPSEVVLETKRLILDTLGCAVGGLLTEKGRLALRLSGRLGGPPESHLPGKEEKVSAASAAYAFGELMNALDFEALLSPPDHATPYVTAAPLAVAEMCDVSGEDFITATALAHELSTRMAMSLVFGNRFAIELGDRGVAMSLPTPGYGLCIFGGVAAAGKLYGLNAEQIAHAMGIAGYSAPIPMLMTFTQAVPAAMPKYLSAGALSHLEVMAVLSAALGCTGDTRILDGDYGFWRAFGCDAWRPEIMIHDLGKTWLFPERLFYKTFPCCGAMQNALALFQELIAEQNLSPEDISRLNVRMNALTELPVWKSASVENHIDAQFNVPFVFSLVAHRIKPGPSWQIPATLSDPRHKVFMQKVEVITDLDDRSRHMPDIELETGPNARKRRYKRNGVALQEVMTEDRLQDKFMRNTRPLLNEEHRLKLAAGIQSLERLIHMRDLMGWLSAS